MAIKTNLIVDQGANFVYNVYLIDVNGDPFDITGYSANAQIRKTYTSTTYNTLNVTLGGNTGLITMSMNATTTANLTNSRYVYDLQLHSNNVTSRILEGIVTVNPEVTR
jgi:FlaG/FlaF family flagellin (archaellin)